MIISLTFFCVYIFTASLDSFCLVFCSQTFFLNYQVNALWHGVNGTVDYFSIIRQNDSLHPGTKLLMHFFSYILVQGISSFFLFLMLLKAFSIGFKSGDLGGILNKRHPTELIASRAKALF